MAGEAVSNLENSTLQGACIQVEFSLHGVVGQGLDQNSSQNILLFFFFSFLIGKRVPSGSPGVEVSERFTHALSCCHKSFDEEKKKHPRAQQNTETYLFPATTGSSP